MAAQCIKWQCFFLNKNKRIALQWSHCLLSPPRDRLISVLNVKLNNGTRNQYDLCQDVYLQNGIIGTLKSLILHVHVDSDPGILYGQRSCHTQTYRERSMFIYQLSTDKGKSLNREIGHIDLGLL